MVQFRDSDDESPPYIKRYSLSDDGQRLIEVVGFKGGRSNGFSMFRVWDRVPPAASPAGQAAAQACYYADDPKKCDKPQNTP